MTAEVLVVGGGIGGLTAAALLAARGLSVRVLEREARAGGCAASCEKFGYEFEPGAGLYAGWRAGEIHERVFAELPVAPPAVRAASPAYIVRLPDMMDVPLAEDDAEFAAHLRAAFPECAAESINFYRDIAPLAGALLSAARRVPDLVTASRLRRIKVMAAEPKGAARARALLNQTAAQLLARTSPRFRRFIDAQLQIFAQRASHECAALYAALALMLPRRGMHTINGGAARLADTLVAAIESSGGRVSLNAPVLRLAYDSAGRAIGVDLLSGETLTASRAIISNLPVWDTYGKLVGLNRTPAEIRARLKELRGWGAYLLFLGMEEAARGRLPGERVLALTDWQEGARYDAERAQFMLSAAPVWDRRAPAGHCAVTVATFTEAAQWFAYHEDETEHEAQDQAALEALWDRLHKALPELGASVEVIETMTPRDFYEQTRRRLGMVGGVGQSLDVFGLNAVTHKTPLPNLFLVGDTVFPGQGIAAVTHSALIVANEIAPPRQR